MVSILAICPDAEDATSFYRGVGPLSYLRKQNKDIEVQFYDSAAWTHLASADILFMQRPFTPAHLHSFKLAKDLNIPVWVDYDDNLLQMTQDNPTHEIYHQADIQSSLYQMICNADVVSTSTKFLAESFMKYNKSVKVIQNAWNDHMFPFPLKHDRKPKDGIFWRGSHTHQNDLFSVFDGVKTVSKEFPDKPWVFIGISPWSLNGAFQKKGTVQFCHTMDLMKYFTNLKHFRYEAQIIPLLDTPFNRSKSNIAWLEGTYAGNTVVCRDWEEWPSDIQCFHYKTAEEFADRIMCALKDPILREAQIQHSIASIQENYLLSKVNQKRLDLIEELLS